MTTDTCVLSTETFMNKCPRSKVTTTYYLSSCDLGDVYGYLIWTSLRDWQICSKQFLGLPARILVPVSGVMMIPTKISHQNLEFPRNTQS